MDIAGELMRSLALECGPLTRRGKYTGDNLTGIEMASIISKVRGGEPFVFVPQPQDVLAKVNRDYYLMRKFFDEVGFPLFLLILS
jgi:hypothetical protein